MIPDILHPVYKEVYSFYPILIIKTIYIFHKFTRVFLYMGKDVLLIACSRVSSEIFSFSDRKGHISSNPSTLKQLCKEVIIKRKLIRSPIFKPFSVGKSLFRKAFGRGLVENTNAIPKKT